jgi:hypothetical protein
MMSDRPQRPFVVPYDWEVAFGAFWGEAVGHSQIRITLYRFTGGTLHLVWSDAKRVKPEATSYFDELVPFKAPGVYRLEVTQSFAAARVGRRQPRPTPA